MQKEKNVKKITKCKNCIHIKQKKLNIVLLIFLGLLFGIFGFCFISKPIVLFLFLLIGLYCIALAVKDIIHLCKFLH